MRAHVADNSNTDPCSGLQSIKKLVGLNVPVLLPVTTLLCLYLVVAKIRELNFAFLSI